MRITRTRIPLLLFLSLVPLHLLAQNDYNSFYHANDPALEILDQQVKKKIHSGFLNQALSHQDTLKIILGSMYLANDHIIETTYSSAMENLIRAGNYASIIRDTLLMGRVNHKKGAVFALLQDSPKAIVYYEKSLGQSKIAKDSQYIAITLEQLARMFSRLRDYDKSNAYYREAIPMVKKFCKPKSLSTALINYGNSLDEQDSVIKAIVIYKKAISISEQIPDEYETIPAKQNLALVYATNDSLDKALELYQECKQANEQNGWLDFLIYSYDGLSLTYDKMGKIDSAFYYFKKFHALKDSVIGTRVQSRVSQLETSNEKQKSDLKLLLQKEATNRQKQHTRNLIIIFMVFLVLSGLGLWLLFQKGKRTKRRLEENRQYLLQLVKFFESKNAELRDLKSQLRENKADQENGEEVSISNIDFYDMNILTESDWQTFKRAFEKSYPKYIQKIRKTFPDISIAEERLFLFIKLQLSTVESANILGIQTETIKKTRNRLRKRLGLVKSEKLNDFVQNF